MARKKTGMTGPTYYTTFQVAKMLGVSPPAVVNWVNSNLLVAHRTPGGHRRIARNDLIAFAKQYEYPLPKDLEDDSGLRRVLVVDDEPDFSEMVKEYLTLQGPFEVEVADSGFSAGLTLARFRPDIILMDIRMPDMDGFEALRMLRADPDTRNIPVIACTAFSESVIDAQQHEEAFDAFVKKPLKLEELVELLKSVAATADQRQVAG